MQQNLVYKIDSIPNIKAIIFNTGKEGRLCGETLSLWENWHLKNDWFLHPWWTIFPTITCKENAVTDHGWESQHMEMILLPFSLDWVITNCIDHSDISLVARILSWHHQKERLPKLGNGQFFCCLYYIDKEAWSLGMNFFIN